MGFLAANPSLVRWWKIREKERENNHMEKFSRKRINRVFQLLQKGIYSILCKLERLLKLQVQEVTFIYTLQKGKKGHFRNLKITSTVSEILHQTSGQHFYIIQALLLNLSLLNYSTCTDTEPKLLLQIILKSNQAWRTSIQKIIISAEQFEIWVNVFRNDLSKLSHIYIYFNIYSSQKQVNVKTLHKNTMK